MAAPQTTNPGAKSMKNFSISLCTVVALVAAPLAHALDAGEAEKLARKSGCLKCHAPAKDKDGPSMKQLAEKWKVKPDAENQLLKHLTSNPMVKIDGKEEKHESLKTDKEAEIRNVIKWYLSH
jgi:cytochrome c